MKRNLKTFILLTIMIPALCVFIWRIQTHIDMMPERQESPESLLYLPSGDYIKPAVLGFDELAADILWIKAISYFGKHRGTDRDFTWLYHILDIITTLDPKYEIAYYFGGIVLAWEVHSVELSNKLLEKGMKNIPEYWWFPFHLGFNYFFSLGQPDIGARYLILASELPNRPDYLPSLVARLNARGGKKITALQFLIEGYRVVQSDDIKKIYFKQLKEILSEDGYQSFTQKVELYKKLHGIYPPDLQAYLTEEVIREIKE